MNAFRCLRVVARPATGATTSLGPCFNRIAASQPKAIPSTMRSISLLAPRRPVLSSSLSFAAAPATPSTMCPSTEALDLMPKISAHPGLGGAMQVRAGPRDTYNPSHFVRKRRHGFLSRLRTKNGRKTLMRRIKKGRWSLSH